MVSAELFTAFLMFMALLAVIIAKEYSDRRREAQLMGLAELVCAAIRNEIAGSDLDARTAASEALDREAEHL